MNIYEVVFVLAAALIHPAEMAHCVCMWSAESSLSDSCICDNHSAMAMLQGSPTAPRCVYLGAQDAG